MAGDKVDMKRDTGMVTVVNFWFINCPPCRMEIPELNELVESYAGNPRVQFVAVALDPGRALKDFLKTMPFRYRIIDNGRYLAERYGIKAYPTHAVVDAGGRVVFHTQGLAGNTVYWIRKGVEEALGR